LAPGLHLPEHNLIRDIEWKQSVDKIKSLYSSKYSNWVEMDATRSKWSLKNEGELLLVEALKRRQTYIDLKSQKKAAPISEVGLSNSFILENRSHFLAYCPVSLVDDQYLHVSYCNTPFMAEFQSKFYYMRDEAAFKLFLNNPERYVGEKLPEELPTKRPKSDLKMFFPKTISFKGYCPVTFAEGPKGFDSIIPGMHDSIVVYEGNLFAFRDEVQLQKFMQRPWKYAHQTLPTKLPPPTAPIPLSGLPVVGYLEQTIATALTKALLNAGSLKPKHPFRTLEQSAKQFVALHLRGIIY
jgi:YHS domain-containing protein